MYHQRYVYDTFELTFRLQVIRRYWPALILNICKHHTATCIKGLELYRELELRDAIWQEVVP